MSGRERDSGPAKLHFRAASFQAFIEEYSPRVSSEGILLPAEERLPEGSPVEFEISLSDDFRVLRGSGEVAWVGEAGVALRFAELEAPSRRLIERLVERHREAGGKPFTLVRWPASIESGEPPDADTQTVIDSLDPSLLGGDEPSPEIVLDPSPARGGSPGRPSRTPVGEDAVLIPAPAFDGEPLPSSRRTPSSPGPVASIEAPVEGLEEGSPIDTLRVPPIARTPAWNDAPEPTLPGREIDMAMETVRVDGLQSPEPRAPSSADPMPSGARQEAMPRPPLPIAGVGRAGAAGGSRRTWMLLFVLLVVAGVVLALRSESVTEWWSRYQGGTAVSEATRPPATDRRAGAAPTGPPVAAPPETQEAVDEVAGEAEDAPPLIARVTAEAPIEPPAGGIQAAQMDQGGAARDALPALTRVLAVEAERVDGGTEVRLVADGTFRADSFNGTRVQGGSPRILIRVLGVGEPFRQNSVQVGSPEVVRVRVGLHSSGGRQDLHFVADLTSDSVRLVSAEARGSTLVLRFAS